MPLSKWLSGAHLLLWKLVSVPVLVLDWWEHFFLLLLFVYFEVKKTGLNFLASSVYTLNLHCSLSLWDMLLRSHEQGGLAFCLAGGPLFLPSPLNNYISYILGAGVARGITCIIFDFCKWKKKLNRDQNLLGQHPSRFSLLFPPCGAGPWALCQTTMLSVLIAAPLVDSV